MNCFGYNSKEQKRDIHCNCSLNKMFRYMKCISLTQRCENRKSNVIIMMIVYKIT
jgi:hypothetical protein